MKNLKQKHFLTTLPSYSPLEVSFTRLVIGVYFISIGHLYQSWLLPIDFSIK